MRVWLGVAGVVAVGMALGVRWWLDHSLPPAPSLPVEIDELDPAVARAIRAAHSEVVDHPRDVNAWMQLGLVYHGNELWLTASEVYERAAAMEPDNARLWFSLGLVRRELGDFHGAIEAMNHACSAAPPYAPAHWRLGLLLLETGKLDDAAAAFERATRIDPSDPPGALGLARVYLMRGECERARVVLEQVLQSLRTAQYADYTRHLLGVTYRCLERQVEPRDPRGAGGIPADTDSIARFADVVEPGSHPHSTVSLTDPWQMEARRYACSASANLEFAMELGSSGRVDEALALLDELQSQGSFSGALISSNMSMLLRSKGRLQESIRAAQEALAINPKFAPAHFNMAMALVARAQSQPPEDAARSRAEAMKHVDEALASNPTYAPAHGLRGQFLHRAGQVDRALEAYEMASRCARDSPLWPLERAKLLLEAGRPGEAVELLEPLAMTELGMVDAFVTLADGYMALSRYDDAQRALVHAARIRPGDASIQQRLRQLADSAPQLGPASAVGR